MVSSHRVFTNKFMAVFWGSSFCKQGSKCSENILDITFPYTTFKETYLIEQDFNKNQVYVFYLMVSTNRTSVSCVCI